MIEAAVIARLLGAAAIATATAGRVDLMRRPGALLPAITVQTISDPRPTTLKGRQFRRTRMQIDVWSATAMGAITLREAAIVALAPATTAGGIDFDRADVTDARPAPMESGDASDQQPRGELYREIIDIIFMHRPA